MVAFLPLLIILGIGGAATYFFPGATQETITGAITPLAIPIGTIFLVIIAIILLYFYMRK